MWKDIIAAIQASRGWTQPQIAKATGCAQTTISDLATGKTTEPRYSLGQALLELKAEGDTAQQQQGVAHA